jgi:hypothetical protein
MNLLVIQNIQIPPNQPRYPWPTSSKAVPAVNLMSSRAILSLIVLMSTEEWRLVPGVVDRERKASERPAYVRLFGKYSSVTLGKLPPGTSQKAGGTFIRFLSKVDAKQFICGTMELPRYR